MKLLLKQTENNRRVIGESMITVIGYLIHHELEIELSRTVCHDDELDEYITLAKRDCYKSNMYKKTRCYIGAKAIYPDGREITQ